MKRVIDITKEYGIVLEGGGAKGAYQIGAWKALKEAGIKIKGIAGSSVGALNGAMMCMDDYELAEEIWNNITYSDVMDVDDEIMRKLFDYDLSEIDFQAVFDKIIGLIKDRGFDIKPLKHLIDRIVDEDKIRRSKRDLFITTYSVDEHRQLTLNIKDVEPGTMSDMLLASAYFFAFKNEKLNGKRYMDGGGLNNVPLDALLEHGYDHIIVIRIYGLGHDKENEYEIPDSTKVYHIAPRQKLGATLKFDKENAKKLMQIGYFDASRMIYDLQGRFYYIDSPFTEKYYFERLLSDTDLLIRCINCDEKLKNKLSEMLNTKFSYRDFCEKMAPIIADELNLKENWDYKDLLIALVENSAKILKIKRYKIYSLNELIDAVRLT